jgi:hypothetical protein
VITAAPVGVMGPWDLRIIRMSLSAAAHTSAVYAGTKRCAALGSPSASTDKRTPPSDVRRQYPAYDWRQHPPPARWPGETPASEPTPVKAGVRARRLVERQNGHPLNSGVRADPCSLARVGLVRDRTMANRGYPDGVFVIGELIDDAIGPDS